MHLSANLVFSNRLEELASALGEELFSSLQHPLERRVVIVPSQNLKRFLLLHIASHPKWRVAAGVQIATLPQALDLLLPLHKFPTPLELSLRIEHEIRMLLSQPKTALLAPLFDYFEGKNHKRLRFFSDELSTLFLQYGKEGGSFLQEWKAKEGWQQTLWSRIFFEGGAWSCPAEALRGQPPLNISISIFGFHFLPEVYVRFFKEQGARFFLLSPCQMYWQDIESEKRRLALKRKLEKSGVPQEQRAAFDSYLKERNRLLANWGKLGREMLSYFDDGEGGAEEHYASSEENLLQKIQSDILFLRSSLRYEPDASLQLHAAPTKQREVELLFEQISGLLRNTPELSLRQILVMAPDIAAYAPYIHSLFAGVEYQIHDLELASQNSFLQAFEQLLSLPSKRFDFSTVLSLLNEERFLKKFSFSPEEASLIKRWMHKAEVRWGIDSSQKEEFFKISYGQANSFEERGTWTHGIDRLIWGMALLENEDEPFSWPLSEVEWTQAELLGRWIEVIELLKTKLKPLYIEDEQRPFAAWVVYLKEIAAAFFSISTDEEPLFQELTELAAIDTVPFDFSSIAALLDKLFKKPSASFQSNRVEAIHFCSFKSGSCYPAEALFLLGMDEEAFPRRERSSSLSAIPRHRVEKIDEERYLFLEALLSARSSLSMSYVQQSEKDEKERGPSLLIQELLSEVKPALEPILHQNRKIPRRESALFFPLFHDKKKISPGARENEVVIALKDLVKCVRNPIQLYMEKQLGIYLKSEEDSDEFILSSLDLSIFRKASLKTPLATLIDKADTQGALPSGPLKRVAIDKVRAEVEAYHQTLSELGVDKEELFSKEFTLEIPLEGERKAVVVGKLPDVSPQGLLFHGKDEPGDWLKAWPYFLIYSQLFSPPVLFFTKEGVKKEIALPDAKQQLAQLIGYYELALEYPSPLLPALIKAFMKKESEGLAKAIKQTLSGESFGYQDPYLSWLALRDPLPDAAALLNNWGEHLDPLLTTLEARFGAV